jgi:hypothetical protein
MASIHKEVVVDALADAAWSAIRDVGAIHTRLAREFVVDTRLEGDSRVVTFAGGIVVRERIVDVDDRARRIAYSVVRGAADSSQSRRSRSSRRAAAEAGSSGSPICCRTTSPASWAG